MPSADDDNVRFGHGGFVASRGSLPSFRDGPKDQARKFEIIQLDLPGPMLSHRAGMTFLIAHRPPCRPNRAAKYQECMRTGSLNGCCCQHSGLARNRIFRNSEQGIDLPGGQITY
jgi:hypothetical protein